ncbi:phosphotransferase enzyme family protein [Histoplasma capsulatum]|uniref:Altered inheritance of mitochondria protein 9, mitochondrial n=1 Tax=Ajellomyces capsulatus TaxID=5037 RepID=A0A8A1M3Q8_AJECA|nr:phosphotransferase enzyme family protein [Histoplasma capsulatum]
MSQAQRFGLVRSLVAIEAKLVETEMPGYGSLYYRDDLQLTDRASAAEYFSAIAKREVECIRTAAQNEPGLMDFGGKDTAREIHINLLNYPTLLHRDLHLENIFVDSADPTKISGIIDWQSTYSAPLFMQARFPSVFDCDDPYPWGAVYPELPDDFADMPEDAKVEAQEQLNRVRLKKFYEMASRKFNPAIPRAMDAFLNENDDPVSFIFPLLDQTAVDGPIPLQELLIRRFERWDEMCERQGGGCMIPCPINYSSGDISRFRAVVEEYAVAHGKFTSLLAQVGGGKDGWVSNEEFEKAMHLFNQHSGELKRVRKRVDDILAVL